MTTRRIPRAWGSIMKLVSALGAVCFFALSLSPATARPHHHQHMDGDGRYTQSDRYWREHVPYRYYSKRRVAHAKHHRSVRHARITGASTGRVCTANDHCARVVAWATSAFQGAIREFEDLGYAIGSPGCLSRGHMRHSKHHWGGACDLFNQISRNKTALRQPPSDVQIAVAGRHGLISGCAWKHPDCGHIEAQTRTASAKKMKTYAAAP